MVLQKKGGAERRKKIMKGLNMVTSAGKGAVAVGKIAQNSKNKKVAKAGTTAVAAGRTARESARVAKGAAKGRDSTKTTAKRTASTAKKAAARFA